MAHLDRVFGREQDVIKTADSEDGGVRVSVFIYRNIPEPGMITGITFGLSCYPYPDWKFGRPEIVLSMETEDIMWPYAAAYFAASFRGKKRFSYGDVFTTDGPLASDTKMDAVFIFAQSIFDKEHQSIQMDNYKLNFSQFYPIHRSELEVYENLGLEKFWKHDEFDLFNPRRPPIRA